MMLKNKGPIYLNVETWLLLFSPPIKISAYVPEREACWVNQTGYSDQTHECAHTT